MEIGKNTGKMLEFEFSSGTPLIRSSIVASLISTRVGFVGSREVTVLDVISKRCTDIQMVKSVAVAGIHFVGRVGRRSEDSKSLKMLFFHVKRIAELLRISSVRDVSRSILDINGSAMVRRRIGGYPVSGVLVPESGMIDLLNGESKGDRLPDNRHEQVYFIQPAGMPFVKIGYGIDPQKRVMDGQVWSPFDLEIIALCPGGCEVESAYHRKFANYRIRGEWFRMSSEIAAEIRRLRELDVDDSRLESPVDMFADSPSLDRIANLLN